ncbi:MAG: alpha/beta hydrolase [Clostridia bacterium]|nr:alpha/beta hydrolase [Clostridia bacterium]
MKKSTKKVLKTAGIVGASAAATYFLIGNFFYYVTLTKKGLENPYVAKVASGSGKKDEERLRLDAIKISGKDWYNSIDKEKLAIKSTNSNKFLHADFIFSEKPSDVYVIVIHGYTSSPAGMGIYVKKYHELGYNVITPSLNGHADSESNVITMGWKDRLDIIDWINFVTENYPESKIILHGESMGSATTMMATGEELPQNVKVAVADCGFTSVWDIFSNKIKNNFKMTEFPTLHSANMVNKLYSGFDFKEASAIEKLKNSKTPTIFIHGDKDTFVPYEMLDKVYDACASEKEKVTIKNSPHARNSCVDPELYWNSIINFINKYI